jgi:hypothetical protein
MFLAAAVLAVSSGCHAARLAVPPDLGATAREAPCKGRQGFAFNGDFSCGPIQVRNVHRSWTGSSGMATWEFVSARARQRYEFAVTDGTGPVWDGQFAVVAGMAQAELYDFLGGTLEIEIDNRASLIGIVMNRETGQVWKLAVARTSGTDLVKGTFRSGTWSIAIDGSRKLAGTPLPISEESGYVLMDEGRALAAVEVINQGAVWIDPAATPDLRGALAAASAALLLYRDLDIRR